MAGHALIVQFHRKGGMAFRGVYINRVTHHQSFNKHAHFYPDLPCSSWQRACNYIRACSPHISSGDQVVLYLSRITSHLLPVMSIQPFVRTCMFASQSWLAGRVHAENIVSSHVYSTDIWVHAYIGFKYLNTQVQHGAQIGLPHIRLPWMQLEIEGRYWCKMKRFWRKWIEIYAKNCTIWKKV